MQGGAIGCADFSKPFVLPTGSTFKDVGGRANVVAVVYMPDPHQQLMPAQVSKYATHIGSTYSLVLPLRPGIASGPNTDWEFGTPSSAPNPQVIAGSNSSKESEDDFETISTYPAGPNITEFDPTLTHPTLQPGRGSSLRRTARRRVTMSTFSLSADLETASSTTQAGADNVQTSRYRNMERADVGCVASEQPMDRTLTPTHENGLKPIEGEAGGSFDGRRQVGIVGLMEYGHDRGAGSGSRTVVHNSPRSDASSEDSGSTTILYAISPRSDGLRSPTPLGALSSPSRGPRSPHAGGADRAAEALQEAEDAFMAADVKYNAAREAQDVDDLDLNGPVNVSLHYPQTIHVYEAIASSHCSRKLWN